MIAWSDILDIFVKKSNFGSRQWVALLNAKMRETPGVSDNGKDFPVYTLHIDVMFEKMTCRHYGYIFLEFQVKLSKIIVWEFIRIIAWHIGLGFEDQFPFSKCVLFSSFIIT